MTGGQKALVAFFGIGIVGTAIYLYMAKKGKAVAEKVNDPAPDPTIQPTDSSGGKTPDAPGGLGVGGGGNVGAASGGKVESFPLGIGSRGSRVTKLQTAIINKFNVGIGGGADGVFGSKTAAAVRGIGYAVPVSEADYNKILAGTKASALSAGADEIAVGDSVYAAKNGVPIYTYPKFDAQYAARDSNRIPHQFNLSTTRIGEVKSRVVSGGFRWLEVSVDRLRGQKYFIRLQDVKKTAF